MQSLLFTISCTQKQWRSYGVVPRYLIAYCHHEWVIMVTVAVYLQKITPFRSSASMRQISSEWIILLFLPDFSRSSCLWMAKTGDTCQLLHHRIATRRTHRGLMACCFSAQETLFHEITTCWHCRGNASKPFKIFACLKSQCDQCLRRLRVMATLEWTPSASWTVQETHRVSTRNLFEFSVDYIVFPCISSRFAAVVNLWNHWDVKLLQRAFHGKNRKALLQTLLYSQAFILHPDRRLESFLCVILLKFSCMSIHSLAVAAAQVSRSKSCRNSVATTTPCCSPSRMSWFLDRVWDEKQPPWPSWLQCTNLRF